MSRPAVGPRDVALSAAIAAGTGLLLWDAWWRAGLPAGAFVPGLTGHGPDPYAWPRLLAVWVPAGHWLFAVAYAALARRDTSRTLRRHFVADQAGLLLVAPLLAAMLLLRGRDPWRTVLSGWYVLFVGLKTAVFLHALWRWLAAETPAPRTAAGAVFLAAFLPYLFLGAHLTTALSTSGDEPFYLLIAHSLLRDGDTNLSNDVAARAYLPFYWGVLDTTRNARTTPEGRLYSRAHEGLQPLLLMPGYWLAGRAGAVVTMNVLSAGAGALAFLVALRAGAGMPGAFLAWLGTAFSVPVLSFSSSPWVEMPGAFFSALAAYLLLADRRRVAGTLTAAGCLVALVALKNRFFLLVVPLVVAFARRIAWRTLLVTGAGLGAALVGAVVYDAFVLQGLMTGVVRTGDLPAALRHHLGSLARPLTSPGLVGVLLDQEHGVLTTAPVFLLALIGVGVAVGQRRWRVLLVAAGPFVLSWYYLSGVFSDDVPLWFGGFNPPARYFVAGLPLLGVFVALALDRVRGTAAWSLVTALYVLSLGHTVVLAVWPDLRYQQGMGRSTILMRVFSLSGLDLGRFLPSYVEPTASVLGPAVGVLLLAVAVGVGLRPRPGTAPAGRGIWLGPLLATLAVGGSFAYAGWQPCGTYPPVAWDTRGGAPFRGRLVLEDGGGTKTAGRLAWATQRDSLLRLAPRLPRGRYRLVLRAGAQGVDGGPTLILSAGQTEARWVPLEAATPPAWRERDYALDLEWAGGRLPIRIQLTGISRGDPARLAYVSQLRLECLRGPAFGASPPR